MAASSREHGYQNNTLLYSQPTIHFCAIQYKATIKLNIHLYISAIHPLDTSTLFISSSSTKSYTRCISPTQPTLLPLLSTNHSTLQTTSQWPLSLPHSTLPSPWLTPPEAATTSSLVPAPAPALDPAPAQAHHPPAAGATKKDYPMVFLTC